MNPNTTDGSVDLALAAKDMDVEGLQVMPRQNLFRPFAEGFVEYYTRVGQAAGLPVILYNVIRWTLELCKPSRTNLMHGVNYQFE